MILDNRLVLTRSEPTDMSPEKAFKHWSSGSGTTLKFPDCTIHFDYNPICLPTGSPSSLWINFKGHRKSCYPNLKTHPERWDEHRKIENIIAEDYLKKHPPELHKKVDFLQQTIDVKNKIAEEQRQKLARIESILKEK